MNKVKQILLRVSPQMFQSFKELCDSLGIKPQERIRHLISKDIERYRKSKQ